MDKPILMTVDEIAKTIVRSYPDVDLLGVDYNTVTMTGLLLRASQHNQGDTLFDFIILEANEVVDAEDDGRADVGQAIRALRRARDDLDKVIAGLENAANAAAGKERP